MGVALDIHSGQQEHRGVGEIKAILGLSMFLCMNLGFRFLSGPNRILWMDHSIFIHARRNQNFP